MHELGHAIQYLIYPETETPKTGRRNIHHNKTFWNIVGHLFEEYEVMNIALENEYKRGRKYLQNRSWINSRE